MSSHLNLFRNPARDGISQTPRRRFFRTEGSRSFRPSIQGLEVRMVPTAIVADVFTDTIGNPAGHFSLREAISFANKNPGPDTIRLLSGIYQITQTGVTDDTNNSGDFDIF